MRSDPAIWQTLAPLAALLLFGCAASTTAARDRAEAVEAMALAATGEPRRCLPLRNAGNFKPVNENVLMVRQSANQWYRTELRARCPNLSDRHTIVVRASGGTVCEGDIFEVVDPVARMNFGVCSFGPFVPVAVPRGATLK